MVFQVLMIQMVLGKISKMPDDKNYSLENLLKAVAQNSEIM